LNVRTFYGEKTMKDLKQCRLLVTPTSYGKSDPRLFSELETSVGEVIYNPTRRPLTSDEVAALLPGIDGYIAGLDVIDRAALQSADCLRVISRYGVGVDNVDLAAARERGVTVTNTPGANAVSVAELAIALFLSLARQVTAAAAEARAGNWPRFNALSLEGKTVGLLGFGAIGRQVARRLQGFDCRVLAYDPIADPEFARAHDVVLVARDEVVEAADFLSLHLPLLPETRGLVDAAFIARMKPGAFLVNTARGELIDEAALLAALESGRLGGAALDVFAKEPPGAGNPLVTHPKVIVTPHIASHTDGATNAMGWIALHDCLAVLRGEKAEHEVGW
jgi:D-3-phosphoglycerate dehydrogenase